MFIILNQLFQNRKINLFSSPSDRQKFFEPVDEGTRRFEIAVDLAAQYLYQLKELEEVINKQKEEIRALKEEKRIAILQVFICGPDPKRFLEF